MTHLARQRRKLANRRKTHLHQLTAAIAARFGGIAVEDLKVKALKCERADGPRADEGTLNRFRERATLKALPANILTS